MSLFYWWNGTDEGKTEVLGGKNLPSADISTINPISTGVGRNLGFHVDRPANNGSESWHCVVEYDAMWFCRYLSDFLRNLLLLLSWNHVTVGHNLHRNLYKFRKLHGVTFRSLWSWKYSCLFSCIFLSSCNLETNGTQGRWANVYRCSKTHSAFETSGTAHRASQRHIHGRLNLHRTKIPSW